jgi:hypothetical protein
MTETAQSTPWPRIVAIGFALAAAVAVILLAFSWPNVTAAAKDLPVAIVGPSAQVQQLENAIEKQSPGAIKFRTADSRDDAITLIKSRTVYGAIVLAQKPEVLTATAASPVVSQLLSAAAAQLQGEVTDVVPLASTDPRGAGLASAAFPLVIGGLLGGIATSLIIVGVWRRLAALLVYGVVGGFGLTGILQAWFGALQGGYLVNTIAVGLTLLAVSATVVGLVSILGRPGIGVSAVIFILIANPISAAAIPLEFLVAPWGAVGQWFPPGAAATLLRDLSYFPAANLAFAWLVLTGWAVAGLLLAAVGHARVSPRARARTEALAPQN